VRDDNAVGDATLFPSQRRFLSRGLLLNLMLVALRIARNLSSVSIGIAQRRGGPAGPELVGA
jgi:hypothetical protein